MDFVIRSIEKSNVIRFQCHKCRNLAYHTPKIVTEHIFFHGFDEFYMNLSWHMKMSKKQPSYYLFSL